MSVGLIDATPNAFGAATELRKIDRQRARPFMFALDRELGRMKRVPRQKQLPLEFCGPTGLDELKIKLFVRPVDFVAHKSVTNRSKMHADLVSSSSPWNCADQTEF